METTDSSYSLTTSKLPQESSVECAIPDASLSAPEEREYLLGWKLHALTLGLCLSLFLANFEISIVSTSLVAITDDLSGFGRSSWVVTAYLLTFTGFLIIWAKLSDIFGRKPLLLATLCIFVVFSGACGAAQTMTQLISLRALQGMGGSGIFSIALVIIYEMVPSNKYPAYTAVVGALFTVSLLLGPLIGGLIIVHTTWRWIFLLNVPAGLMAMVGLVFALQQAAEGWSWSSALVASCFVVSAILWPAFIVWEWLVTSRGDVQEPVFPWRFVKNRVVLGLLLSTFFTGVLFTVCVIQLPLKFQAEYDTSPLSAGIYLLPFTLACPTGSFVVAILTRPGGDMPPILMLLIGAGFQIIGVSLMSTVKITKEIWTGQYGYEVITGLGVGMSIGAASIIAPFIIEIESDLSVIASSVVQFRVMGGAVGLAVVTCIANTYIKSHLVGLLTDTEIVAVFESLATISKLPLQVQEIVRSMFARGFILQMKTLIGFGVVQFPAVALMWQKKAIRVT